MLAQKIDSLRDALNKHGSVLVAFSGGVDSSFLLKVANDVLGENCHALTCVSETMASSEQEDARKIAREIGLGTRHHVLQSAELTRPGFAENNLDRCAKCKTELMSHAVPLAEKLGINAIAIGTNIDDLGDFRPGIRAAQDQGAIMPMVDANLTKDEIRQASKEMKLSTWNKPQLACLSSRFPTGTPITAAKLKQVDALEQQLRSLGFRELRVRYHDTIARLEFPVDQLELALSPDTRHRITQLTKDAGFRYVTIDLEGFRSGSMNPIVPLRRK